MNEAQRREDPLDRFVMCCVCNETLTDEESNLGYCEDCRNGHDDLESLMEAV